MEIYILMNHFKDQLNLTATNFAFRDYYQVVNQTKKTYLSDAILSKATGLNLAVIATPVINHQNEPIGILLGTINFNNYDKFLQSLNLQNNTRLVMIDKNGAKLVTLTKMRRQSQQNLLRRKNSFHILPLSSMH